MQFLVSPLVDPPGVLDFHWTTEAIFWILLSGLAAFLVNFSGFLILGNIGALAHVLLGNHSSSRDTFASLSPCLPVSLSPSPCLLAGQATQPRSFSFSGQLKTAAVCLGATVFFGAQYPPLQVAGALGAVCCIIAYSHVTIGESPSKNKEHEYRGGEACKSNSQGNSDGVGKS